MTRWVPQGISQGWTGKSVPLTHVSNAQIKGVINYHKQVTYIEKKNNYSVLNPTEEWLFAPFKILKIIPIHSSYYLILLNFLSSITQLFIINCHYRYIFVSYSFFFWYALSTTCFGVHLFTEVLHCPDRDCYWYTAFKSSLIGFPKIIRTIC